MTTMKFSEIRVSKNIRRALGDIQELAEQITRGGLQDPLWVRPDGELLRGHRRHAALKVIRSIAESSGVEPLPFDDVPVEIKEGFSDTDRIYAQLTDRDGCRKNLTAWEICCALYDLRKSGLSFQEIADRVNLSSPDVQKKIKIREVATDEVRVMLDRGLEVPLVVLHSFSRVAEEQQIIEVKKWFEPGRRSKPGPKKKDVQRSSSEIAPRVVVKSPRKISTLLTDVKAAHPENKLAIQVLRYVLGLRGARPVPSAKTG